MTKLVELFPVWLLLACILSFSYPDFFTWFQGWMITGALGVIMLGMGVTLTSEDFKRVLLMPKHVIVGAVLQYSIMPLLGFSISKALHLSPEISAGLILVASCPGGTASNVVTYIAKGDVALSVTMTAVSTLVSPIFTPLLTLLLSDSRIQVDAFGLMINTLYVVIIPVFVGVFINRYFGTKLVRIMPIAPLVSVFFIIMIVASVIGNSSEIIRSSGGWILVSAFLLHGLGFFFGYIFSSFLTKDTKAVKTISIEVGMQNSGLGVVLAKNNFSDPITAVPSAVSSLFHSLIASLLAIFWRKKI